MHDRLACIVYRLGVALGKVHSALDRPIQGVSQQPAKTRKGGQAALIDNMIPSVVDGLKSRSGTINVGKVLNSIDANAKIHHYRRGDGEEYFIVISPDGSIDIYSPDGTQHIVTMTAGTGYLTCSNPRLGLASTTIADFTFLVNKDTVVNQATTTAPARDSEAMVYCQFATYGKTYQILIDDVVFTTYAAPDGSLPAHAAQVDTTYVATQLMGTKTGYTITRSKNVIYIKRDDGGALSVTTRDGGSGKDLVAINEHVYSLVSLPPTAVDGFMVEVRPEGGLDDAAYWLQASGTFGETVKWVESPTPGSLIAFDKTTMPHTLIRQSITAGVATFELTQGDWIDRDVGDDYSNPWPSFVDQTIKAIGAFQNRLYVTSGEAVCMSKGDGSFFDFFRETTQIATDTDPIDVYADSEQINELVHAILMDGDLVFFSQNAQFLLPGNKPVTKASATLKLVNSFKNNTDVAPIPAGENIFFPFTLGAYTGIREFFTDSVTDTKRAQPITDHVEKYIEGTPRAMTTSTNLNWLFVLSTGATNVLYIYNWLWLGTEKAQSAWHRWVWPEDERIEHIQFSQDKVYLTITRADGVYLEYFDVGEPDTDGLTFPVRLDRQVVQTATKQASGLTTMSVPFPDSGDDDIRFIKSTGCYEEEVGSAMTFVRNGAVYETSESLFEGGAGTTCKIIIGRKYLARFRPTPPTIKDYKDRVIGIDPPIIGRVYINYEGTGFFKVDVEYKYGDPMTYEFSGRVFGDVNNIVGFAELEDGQFQLPIRERADRADVEIYTDSHLPLQIRDLEWMGQYNPRGRRI